MKKLTNFAVESVMDLLIHTNGQTTTLEIKNTLRELGYFAEQKSISSIVESIYDSNDYKYEREAINNTYNVYKFTEDFIDDNSEFEIAQDYVSNSQPNISSVSGKQATFTKTNPALSQGNTPMLNFHNSQKGGAQTTIPTAKVAAKATMSTNSRDPLFIFYTENHARKSGVDANAWVVYHKNGNNEIQIYDKTLTRDQVRSRYASILKVKIQDVRSCKFMNY